MCIDPLHGVVLRWWDDDLLLCFDNLIVVHKLKVEGGDCPDHGIDLLHTFSDNIIDAPSLLSIGCSRCCVRLYVGVLASEGALPLTSSAAATTPLEVNVVLQEGSIEGRSGLLRRQDVGESLGASLLLEKRDGFLDASMLRAVAPGDGSAEAGLVSCLNGLFKS